jgi:hypothetical protein
MAYLVACAAVAMAVGLVTFGRLQGRLAEEL